MISLQICAIEAYAISFYQINLPEECVESCKIFLSAVISILKSPRRNDLTQKMIESCNHSICILIKRLGVNFIPFAEEVIPGALEDAQASIEITPVGAMDFTNEGFSFQMQIPSTNVSGVKQFVNKSEVQSVCKALDIINAAEKAMKNDFYPYLGPTVEIARQWLTSQYHIEPIMISSCNILRSAIFVSIANESSSVEDLELIFDLYLHNITPLASQKLLEALLMMIQDTFYSPHFKDLNEI